MKVKYIDDYYKIKLIKNKVYSVIGIEYGWYKLIDELGDDGFFPPEMFEIIEK